jgi:hypothetical protein
MTAAVLLLKWKAPLGHSLSLRLIVEIAVGGVAYLTTLFLFHRERVSRFMQIAKSLRRGQKLTDVMQAAEI